MRNGLTREAFEEGKRTLNSLREKLAKHTADLRIADDPTWKEWRVSCNELSSLGCILGALALEAGIESQDSEITAASMFDSAKKHLATA